MARSPILEGLNQEQCAAVTHGEGPLLIIAGAGTGKTKTLVHRVAHVIERAVDPRRVLLLTFTRRAAAEMLRRVDQLLRQLAQGSERAIAPASSRIWGGTFHAIASRLLRVHGQAVGLTPDFTIHDRSDSEDLMDLVRTELGVPSHNKRFPRKGTCVAIYSHCVNSGQALPQLLENSYPWCQDYVEPLKKLFQAYTDRKEEAGTLDYDDLLLFWQGMLADPQAGPQVRQRFDAVFVDEYQDTNQLQFEILRGLRPDGQGITVVGDDAQSIYSFRSASVKNILEFPQKFEGTQVVKLEQNYRSSSPILCATNQVMQGARQRYEKNLWSSREHGSKPLLVTCQDEDQQAQCLVQQILEHREAGIDLRRQAVLFRASHHSILLEAQLARHNIPFVKYGGLKFIEAAHVKDLMAFLRLAENPRDVVSGCRVLMLLPGIGPKKSHQLMQELAESRGDFGLWKKAQPSAGNKSDAGKQWRALIKLMEQLSEPKRLDTAAQVHLIRKFYSPLLEDKYDNAEPRLRDLEQLELLASRYGDRNQMLAEMALDPPSSTEDLAADPLLDEEYLILSTIHSAKGLEWDAVYVIHASDGNIPSDMATRCEDQIEEERRLFYVALTRAKDWLTVVFPQRYYFSHQYRGDSHSFAQLTRFLDEPSRRHFECRFWNSENRLLDEEQPAASTPSRDVRKRVRAMWD